MSLSIEILHTGASTHKISVFSQAVSFLVFCLAANGCNLEPIQSSVVVTPELVFPLFYFQALDLTLAKDDRLAVGFFQRSAVMMQINRHEEAQTKVHWFITWICFVFLFLCILCFRLYRLEEALSDCIWAQKHMRGNTVIDYKQLGLRFKLSSWQVGITRNVAFHSTVLLCTVLGH